MRPTRIVVLLLALLAALPAWAHANLPPGDPPPSSGDTDKSHVHKLKPWRARFEYQLERTANAYAELNARSDVTAEVVKDQWWKIDCQMYHVTQKGNVLWDHVANIGWIADHNFRTYTDGRLAGSPSCDNPGPDHVWFKQGWANTKQYRLVRTVPIRTRPAGAQRGSQSLGKGAWTTIDCSAQANGRAWVRVYRQPKVGEGWIGAAALRFWQKGLPAGLPRCAPEGAPLHLVTLGDSYAAGIGAGSYYDGSGSCWRSSRSYWALLETQLREGLISDLADFEACSGDTTSDLLGKLGRLNKDTRLVTVSIGGNDLHFSSIVKACVKPLGESCKGAVAKYITASALDRLRRGLDRVYRAVRARAPHALVLVMGYPELTPRDHIDGCGAMDDGDAPALHRTATLVNGAIDDTVGVRPGFRFVGLVRTFLKHPACDKDSTDWINGVTQISGPGLEASFHPNALGNFAIAGRIKAAVPRFFR